MSTEEIYSAFKDNLKKSVNDVRLGTITRGYKYRQNYIFGIASSNDRLYYDTIAAMELQACKETELLLGNLCDEYKNKYLFPDDKEHNCDIMIDDGKKIWKVEIKSAPRLAGVAKSFAGDECFVFLMKKCVDSYELISESVMAGQCVNPYLLSDFIKEIFGEKESQKFDKAFANFSDEMKELIGYDVTKVCTDENLRQLKDELDTALSKYVFVDKEGKLDSWELQQLESCFRNNYDVLLANRLFAESFLTSEWLYLHASTNDNIDNTFIVAGYLKSMEQLLWDVIQVKCNGMPFTTDENGNILTLGADEISDGYTMLQSCADYLYNNYDDILALSFSQKEARFVSKYITKYIAVFRKNYRNGHFHKHNIDGDTSMTVVESIRTVTYELYYLILGMIELDPSEKQDLMDTTW